jgi:hypothetical protein
MSDRVGLPAAICLLAAILAPAPAAAQVEVSGERAGEAEALFNAGVAAFERGDYAAALAAFKQSYQLNPVPDVLYNIGMCNNALGNLPAAANAFRDYSALVNPGPSSPEGAEIRGLLQQLFPRVARLTVEVDQDRAVISVDGVASGVSPFGTWIAVEPGRHTITVTKDGFTAATLEVEVAAGDSRSVTLAMTANTPEWAPPPEATPPPPPTPTEAEEGWFHPSAWFWSCVGATGAATLGMIITGSLALKYNDDFNAGGWRDADLHDTTVSLGIATDVLLGLALAGAVAGTVLLFTTGGEDEAAEAPATGAAIAPGGIVVRW